MITGCLVAESLRPGAVLETVSLRTTRIWRGAAMTATDAQPTQWTLFNFEADDADSDRLAEELAANLNPHGGWYCDLTTDSEKFVVFADRIFRYPRGDQAGHAEAAAYGRSVGVPEPQLDWGD